ncbi:MAG: hypothetical protein ACRYG8_32755 [Janthinobacterium lividum]
MSARGARKFPLHEATSPVTTKTVRRIGELSGFDATIREQPASTICCLGRAHQATPDSGIWRAA